MSEKNKYLKETPLTTTVNKLLEKHRNADSFDNSSEKFQTEWIKRSVVEKKFNKRPSSTDRCRSGKFPKQDIFSKKKKKKKIRRCVNTEVLNCPTSLSFEQSRSASDDNLMKRDCVDFGFSQKNFASESNFHTTTSSTIIISNKTKFFSPVRDGSRFKSLASAPAPPSISGVFENIPVPALSCITFGSTATFGGVQLSQNSFTGDCNEPEKIILKMPAYELNIAKLEEEEYESFSYPNDSDYLGENSFANQKRKKIQFLNVVSMALMYNPNFKDCNDAYRKLLLQFADAVRFIDPQFILKIALYARQELQIRTVTNFLLSYAALHKNTLFYLEKYFDASIVLPTDWIQVAEYYEILSVGEKKPFPAALRKVMTKTFSKFDEYQLAKYNRDRPKKKKNEDQSSKEDCVNSIDENLNMSSKEECVNSKDENLNKNIKKKISKKLTMKQLIRRLHISSPPEHVMCLLGKKYPNSYVEFVQSGLPGTWDPRKAGMRMKLPIPFTWETQVSAKGNKSHVWESLIDCNKLPYMATLRNLKNLIMSGISSAHHMKVINVLENKESVINSRQLPLQFFEAYKVITNLQNSVEDEKHILECLSSQGIPERKKAQLLKEMKDSLKNVSVPVLEQYKSAITKALEISSLNNLNPIPGKTLIICQLGFKTNTNKDTFKVNETCIMEGLMCLKASEDCKMNIISYSQSPDVILLGENDKFLDILMKTCEKYKQKYSTSEWCSRKTYKQASSLNNILAYYLKPHIMLSLKLDHIVFLQTSPEFDPIMTSFLRKYRHIVNEDLLYTNVDFSLGSKSFTEERFSDKDVYLCGSSSSLIKFIAERSNNGQLTSVENIDLKYKLKNSVLKKPNDCNLFEEAVHASDRTSSINYRLPKWHTVRVFISSTFKDMMSERDLLVRYVFPELKRRAASIFIRIVEIDLRWGITEADSSTKRAAELCLTEAQKADLFIGLIGDRYGTIYNFEPPDASDLQWVQQCPVGLSITELEMYAAALRNPETSQKKTFFYFRDNSFLKYVPAKWASHFTSEDMPSKVKVDKLKSKIRSNGFNILDGYPCYFAGNFENKPILEGLDVLGNRILEDLWTTIQEIHSTDPYCDIMSEEEKYQQNIIDSLNFFIKTKNSPIKDVVRKIESEHGIFVISGVSGSGKTAFAINLLQNLEFQIIVKFFIGVSPRSRDLSYILQYICNTICHQLDTFFPLPSLPNDIVNQFPDFLFQIASYCGGKDFIVLIDGLDHLDITDQRLDWLPLLLPDNVKLIFTVTESSEAFNVLYERKKHDKTIFIQELPTLLQADREQFVREYLSYYRKTLDESAFNNYLLKLVTKRNSSNPFYLRTICDFLRIFGCFDNLLSLIYKLPSSTVFVFQAILKEMEKELGLSLMQTVMTLLCITKEGLEDNDLHYIISFVMHMNEKKALFQFDELKRNISTLEPEYFLSQIVYCTLMHTISTFAFGQIRQKSYSLIGTEFENAIKKFYMNDTFSPLSKKLHCVLAAYYHSICDKNNDEKYSGQVGNAFRCVLHHMFYGDLYKELNDLLCNHKFIEAVFRTTAGDELLDYYSLLLYDVLPRNPKVNREIDDSFLLTFYDFVSRNFHIFYKSPQLVMQQALNEPSDSVVNIKNGQNFCSLENLSRFQLMDCRITTLSGFVKNITASAGKKGNTVILGTEDGYLKALDLSTRKIIRTIKGHASAITCIAFVGKRKICASSADGTLSLWDSTDFTRIAVMKGHKHKVTSCCSDPFNTIIFSSGWDNTVRLWIAGSGSMLSVIDDFRCPVNCIDHHPVKQQIACGLWNGNIEIWDTVSMERKLAFSNFCGSVKSLAFTPDGVNIISAFIQSEISVWSTEEGLKISSLKGHNLPVKSLTHSFNENIFVSGSEDCTLKVWSAVHGAYFSTIPESKFCPVNLMEFMTENLLAVAFQNSEIWIIDIINGNVISKTTLEADTVSTFSKYSSINLRYTNTENVWYAKSLVFGTQTGKLMIHNSSSSSLFMKANMSSKITAIIHNRDIILCGTAGGEIGAFSHPDISLFKKFDAHKSFVSTFCLSIQCEKLFVLSTANDNVLKLWCLDSDSLDFTLQQEFFNKHNDGITYSLFYPSYCDSKVLNNLLTGSHDNNIILWNENSMKKFRGLQSSVLNITCSGDYILGCGNDGAVIMWSLENGTTLTSIPKIELSSAILAFHVEEDVSDKFKVNLAFVDQDGSIKIKKPLQKTYCCSLDGHNKPITSCCTTLNEEIVSCSLDGSVSVWKLPTTIPDNPCMHFSVITGLILSSSLEFAVSSDAKGNLIVWKTQFATTAEPLTYAGKKSYKGGFIRALSWLKNNSFVCAVNQVSENEEVYFIDIIHLKCDTDIQTALFNLEVRKSYNFESEVLCLDSCSDTDRIILGLKSGEVMVITSETVRLMKICDDWLLGICLSTSTNTSDSFCASFIDGSVKMFSIANFLNSKFESINAFEECNTANAYQGSKYTSSLYCGENTLCCGDSDGILRVYIKISLTFFKKAHESAISGICVIGSYLFTSSLDKTVKGWNLHSLKQVCLFHSNAPVSYLTNPQRGADFYDPNSHVLLIGTTTGNVHVLKFYCK